MPPRLFLKCKRYSDMANVIDQPYHGLKEFILIADPRTNRKVIKSEILDKLDLQNREKPKLVG
jgi:hypothetical protein